jgi:hypothetical protein
MKKLYWVIFILIIIGFLILTSIYSLLITGFITDTESIFTIYHIFIYVNVLISLVFFYLIYKLVNAPDNKIKFYRNLFLSIVIIYFMIVYLIDYGYGSLINEIMNNYFLS